MTPSPQVGLPHRCSAPSMPPKEPSQPGTHCGACGYTNRPGQRSCGLCGGFLYAAVRESGEQPTAAPGLPDPALGLGPGSGAPPTGAASAPPAPTNRPVVSISMDDDPEPPPMAPRAEATGGGPAAALPSIRIDDEVEDPTPETPPAVRAAPAVTPSPGPSLPSVSLDDDEPGLSVSLPAPTPRAPLPPRDEAPPVFDEPEVESRYGEPVVPHSVYGAANADESAGPGGPGLPSPEEVRARAQDPALLRERERQFRRRVWRRWLLHGVSGVVLFFLVRSAFTILLGGMATALQPAQVIWTVIPAVIFGFPLGFTVSRLNAGLFKGGLIGMVFGALFAAPPLLAAMMAGDPLGYVHLAVGAGVGVLTGALMGFHVDMDN